MNELKIIKKAKKIFSEVFSDYEIEFVNGLEEIKLTTYHKDEPVFTIMTIPEENIYEEDGKLYVEGAYEFGTDINFPDNIKTAEELFNHIENSGKAIPSTYKNYLENQKYAVGQDVSGYIKNNLEVK